MSRPVREGYRKPAASRNRRARTHRAFLALALALLSSGCAFTMNIPGFGEAEPENTGSITPTRPQAFAIALDDEDWRRADAALSLAVDPQGAGLPVNWDNPASRRSGRFEPIGGLAVVGDTICRPFRAMVMQQPHEKLAAREVTHEGQACRTGPGEWAMRDVKPLAAFASGAPQDITASNLALPKASSALLPHAPSAAPRRD